MGFPDPGKKATAACAAFVEESRMKISNADKLHWKSGDMGHPISVAGEGNKSIVLPTRDGASTARKSRSAVRLGMAAASEGSRVYSKSIGKLVHFWDGTHP